MGSNGEERPLHLPFIATGAMLRRQRAARDQWRLWVSFWRELIGVCEYAGWSIIDTKLVPFFPELVNTLRPLLFTPPLKCFPLTDIVKEGHAETTRGHHQINIEIQDLPCAWQWRKQRDEFPPLIGPRMKNLRPSVRSQDQGSGLERAPHQGHSR
jgi:hypothetical protein